MAKAAGFFDWGKERIDNKEDKKALYEAIKVGLQHIRLTLVNGEVLETVLEPLLEPTEMLKMYVEK